MLEILLRNSVIGNVMMSVVHAIQGMKFHDPPMGSGLGPQQERLVWAHGMIHPSGPSSSGRTISNGFMGHHDQTIMTRQ